MTSRYCAICKIDGRTTRLYKGLCCLHGSLWTFYVSCKEIRLQRDELLAAARTVHDTFVKDEARGYRSRDRQYAIAILGPAITKADSDSAPRKDSAKNA